MTQHTTKRYWLDSAANVTKLYRGLWVIGITLVILDLLIHRHEHFGVAEFLGFHAGYGFFACVILVIAAKGLRILLKRPEDYYEH